MRSSRSLPLSALGCVLLLMRPTLTGAGFALPISTSSKTGSALKKTRHHEAPSSSTVGVLLVSSVGRIGAAARTGPSFTSLTMSTEMTDETLKSLTDPLASLLLRVETGEPWWQNTDVWVFVAGIIPFAWAAVEFWRRIAVGEPFGTGKDSVYIGNDNAPLESRGRRTLDRGAFIVAYILFGLAAGAIGITLYSVVNAPTVEFTTTAAGVTQQ